MEMQVSARDASYLWSSVLKPSICEYFQESDVSIAFLPLISKSLNKSLLDLIARNHWKNECLKAPALSTVAV